MTSGTAKQAVVLLSGGLDSATCLAIARSEGFGTIHTIAFDYGQRHRTELSAAALIAARYGASHRVATIDLRAFGGSALTADIEVPKDRPADDMSHGIPITYVPARNTIFLSFSLALAEVTGCRDIYIGVNALDYSGYPDCRPEYIAAFELMANLATRSGVEGPAGGKQPIRIHTPLIDKTKAQIIQWGHSLSVDYSLTHSCYDPSTAGLACGHCDSCILRKKGFAEARIADPTRYVPGHPN
jgi:7-cyano-7-deazaguanine synthase